MIERFRTPDRLGPIGVALALVLALVAANAVYFFLQPVVFALGVLEMFLAWLWTRPTGARSAG